jgi:hypothetical protein
LLNTGDKPMSDQDDKKGIVIKFDPIEYEALRAIGDGNLSEGFRVCLRWAVHFHAIGLRSDDNLDYVGLCTVSD